jgi:Protein of unknown function (DUF3995)
MLTISGLHVAWGHGSTFPFSTPAALTDNVVGAPRTPSLGACYAVATGLAGAAALVAIATTRSLHRRALGVLAAIFGTRSLFGFAGHTDLLVPGSASAAFRTNDRWLFSPVCAGLAMGVLSVLRRRSLK